MSRRKKPIRLTYREIKSLFEAAGNIDPCMFHEGEDEKEGERAEAAWRSGRDKLEAMLERRETIRVLVAEKHGEK